MRPDQGIVETTFRQMQVRITREILVLLEVRCQDRAGEIYERLDQVVTPIFEQVAKKLDALLEKVDRHRVAIDELERERIERERVLNGTIREEKVDR